MYGEEATGKLLAHYEAEKPAETLLGELNREAVIVENVLSASSEQA